MRHARFKIKTSDQLIHFSLRHVWLNLLMEVVSVSCVNLNLFNRYLLSSKTRFISNFPWDTQTQILLPKPRSGVELRDGSLFQRTLVVSGKLYRVVSIRCSVINININVFNINLYEKKCLMPKCMVSKSVQF